MHGRPAGQSHLGRCPGSCCYNRRLWQTELALQALGWALPAFCITGVLQTVHISRAPWQRELRLGMLQQVEHALRQHVGDRRSAARRRCQDRTACSASDSFLPIAIVVVPESTTAEALPNAMVEFPTLIPSIWTDQVLCHIQN